MSLGRAQAQATRGLTTIWVDASASCQHRWILVNSIGSMPAGRTGLYQSAGSQEYFNQTITRDYESGKY